MGLAFARASSNGRPADEVGNILRGDGIKEFGGGGQAERKGLFEKGARFFESF